MASCRHPIILFIMTFDVVLGSYTTTYFGLRRKSALAPLLALNLHKDFHSVRHAAIASNLAAADPGERTYNYTCDFSKRTVPFFGRWLRL
ncbi:hypothetical protein MTO96_041070 [Rhipicephalus appendiculatus]